jgi:hypothetical protein
MVFKPEAGRRYDMPVMFGPSELGGKTTYGETHMIAHAFHSEPAALEALIPYHFKLADPARVSVTSRMIRNVDWLAGRDYNTVRVSVDVEATDRGQRVKGPYGLVVWETDANAVIAGREFLGISKIVGEIPEHERSERAAAFECYEYGTRLLRVDVTDVQQADAATVERANDRGDLVTLGWKYIPAHGGSIDADYPTKMVSRGTIRSMWTGTSTITFDETTWEQCPISSRIVRTLAALPVVEVLPATLTVSTGMLDRDSSARLS